MPRRIIQVSVAAILLVAIAIPLTPRQSAAQRAVATSGLVLHKADNSGSTRFGHISEGDTVTILRSDAESGYDEVRTVDGHDGWAWARRLQVVDTAGAEPATDSTGIAAAGGVDPSWERVPSNAVDYTWPDKSSRTCADSGGGKEGFFDPETNRWKNRTDEPAEYHDLSWDALASLEVPRNSLKYRGEWTDEDKAILARYEGIPVRVVGFLSGAKQEIPAAKGSKPAKGESTNCGEASAAHVDWHLYLTKHPQEPKYKAIVIETTPRVRFLPQHANWKFPDFQKLAQGSDSVRVSGWLMFDPEHWDQMYRYDPAKSTTQGKYRITLWEIHPITRVEVWRGGRWVDID